MHYLKLTACAREKTDLKWVNNINEKRYCNSQYSFMISIFKIFSKER